MGRLRKTTDELDRKGAFDKNPKRAVARAAEPIFNGALGEPPGDFCRQGSPSSMALNAIWYELLDMCEGIKLRKNCRGLFENTCRLLDRTRRPGAKTGDFTELKAHYRLLGLTPADSSRVEGEGRPTAESEEDEWNEFAGGGASVRLH